VWLGYIWDAKYLTSMEIKEIEDHLSFFNNINEGIGNAFRVSINPKLTKSARKVAEDLLKERIMSTRNYVEEHNLYDAITVNVYSSDRSFELYDLNIFEKDVPKVIRWLKRIKLDKEATSSEEE
jgi:hypothetical protein